MVLFRERQTPEMLRVMENIAQVEAEEQEKIFKLGQMFYENHKNDMDLSEPYCSLVDIITKMEENRKGFVKSKLQLEGKMMCENCGSIIPYGSVFCGSCGKKADQKSDVQTRTEERKTCSKCGGIMEEGMDFCVECGTKAD